ncbi:MAG: V-type ATP synthase subunit E family protein [Anaerolineaceae bacterium]|nr:V-type ATP synthase subunit E family protein [Anaerolineaceae bacterium]
MELLSGKDFASEENLAELCRQIEVESEADCAELHKAAAEQEAAILASSQEQADKLRKKILDSAGAAIADFERSGFAEVNLKAKHRWLESREALLNQVREALFARFDEVLKQEAYAEALPGFILEASNALASKTLIVRADPATQALLSPGLLDSTAKKYQLSLTRGNDLNAGHGIIAFTPDGRRLFDNTLEARYERNKTQLRNLAAHKLFEGQE